MRQIDGSLTTPKKLVEDLILLDIKPFCSHWLGNHSHNSEVSIVSLRDVLPAWRLEPDWQFDIVSKCLYSKFLCPTRGVGHDPTLVVGNTFS